jgi:signal recognition particle receptor subunit beta
MVSIDTETERTLYFDLLPLELGMVHGFRVRFQLYTVPGQVLYQQTRLSVLRGADCVVFVADSQANKLQENIESFKELTDQLRSMGKNPGEFPIVLQWNKRDLPGTLPLAQLRGGRGERAWRGRESALCHQRHAHAPRSSLIEARWIETT